jgi:hypothetical protein
MPELSYQKIVYMAAPLGPLGLEADVVPEVPRLRRVQ